MQDVYTGVATDVADGLDEAANASPSKDVSTGTGHPVPTQGRSCSGKYARQQCLPEPNNWQRRMHVSHSSMYPADSCNFGIPLFPHRTMLS